MEFLKNFQNIQSKVNEAQEKMKDLVVTGSAGGDMVRIEINGQMQIQNVIISPEAVDPEDVSMIEDLVLAAFNDAMVKIKEKMQEEISSATGGMNLPPGLFGA
jgi:hypothetical protein